MKISREFWELLMNQIQNEYEKESRLEEYKIWISVIKPIDFSKNELLVEVPSEFMKSQIIKRGILNYLECKISENLGNKCKLHIQSRNWRKSEMNTEIIEFGYGLLPLISQKKESLLLKEIKKLRDIYPQLPIINIIDSFEINPFQIRIKKEQIFDIAFDKSKESIAVETIISIIKDYYIC